MEVLIGILAIIWIAGVFVYKNNKAREKQYHKESQEELVQRMLRDYE